MIAAVSSCATVMQLSRCFCSELVRMRRSQRTGLSRRLASTDASRSRISAITRSRGSALSRIFAVAFARVERVTNLKAPTL